MTAIKYRPDIDGLRAIAVLMVVLYHADIKLFGGGFVGVDVFFVISGFLITALIQKDLAAGTFSFAGFWERRARRILPALTAVTFTVFAAAWAIFLPKDFIGAGYQVASQSIAASNFYFESVRGYFDTAEEVKPLLHTWSLAVEEQFYFIFPVIMWLAWRYMRRRLMPVLWVIAGLSFAAASWMVFKERELAFFMLPFRAWELMMGALLALYGARIPAPERAAQAGGLIGLALVLGSGIFYYSKMVFPGAAALLPCLGAVLIIWSGQAGATFTARILSRKAFVFIGLVSYSWYLWHWPLLSFGKYVMQNEFGKPEKIACVVVSFLLAAASWKFIETPFRRKDGLLKSRKAVFTASFAALSLMALGGLYVVYKDGVPGRIQGEALMYAQGQDDKDPALKGCNLNKFERIGRDDICQSNPEGKKKPAFVLWGDSHADAIAPAFIRLSKEHGVNGYIAFKHDCPPILDVHHKSYESRAPTCTDYNTAHFEFIKRSKIKHVYLVATWSNWAKDKNLYFDKKDWYPAYQGRYENIVMAGVQRTVDELQKIGVKVYFLIDGPTMRFEPPRKLALESIMGVKESKAYMPLDTYMRKRSQNIDDFVERNKGTALVIADMKPLLCKDGKCISGINGRSLYFDHNHFSAYGAHYLAPVFEPFFEELN